MRQKLSLNFKIGSIVAVMTLGSGAISWIGMSKLSTMQASLKDIVEVQGRRVKDLYKFERDAIFLVVMDKNFLLDENPKERDNREKQIIAQDKLNREEIDQIRSEALDEDKQDVEAVKDAYLQYMEISTALRAMAKEGKPREAIQLSESKGHIARTQVIEKAQTLLDEYEKKMAEAQAQGELLHSRAKDFMLLFTFLSMSLGIVLAILTMRAIGKSISQAIGSLKESSNHLSSSAESVATTSSQISQATTEQASVVQETASSIEQMSSMVAKNSESASQASDVAGLSQKRAVRGKEVVEKMIHSIQEIDSSNSNIMDQMGQSNQKLTEIVHVISEIATKTQVINDIVFQTKLLSFNASVEAARAGEHGRGFAVVAEEVGKLAQMSGNAAREITSILGESIQKVEGIVEQTKSRVDSLVGENKSKVSDGVQIAKECGGVLDEIVGSISKLNEMASSISSASQEQAQGVREITQAMSQLDEATQHNASSSEEAAQAAARLTAQASSLQSIIDSLTESIYGTHKTRGFMKGLFSKASTSKPSKSSALPSVSAEARHELVSFGPKKSAASRDELKGPIAEVIPLPTKSSSASVSNEGPTLKLKTAAVGTVSSFPSPDDERFKDV